MKRELQFQFMNVKCLCQMRIKVKVIKKLFTFSIYNDAVATLYLKQLAINRFYIYLQTERFEKITSAQ